MKLPFSVIFLIYFASKSHCVTNNVCATFEDYYTLKDNPNCWYDLAADSNATEIIKSFGYPLEIHKVTTKDGYILSVFRIPNYNAAFRKGPVFIQHGLYSTAANFLGRGKESLAFVLADAGYDVWLGNYRGTEYSEGHANLTVFDKQYWEYSLDELGMHDVPAMLNFVAKETGQKGNVVYIGHSLGTTLGMIYGSALPRHAKQTVKLFILLAPAATMANMISPVRLLAPFASQILRAAVSFDLIRLTSQAETQRQVIKLYCLESPVLMQLCLQALNLFYGPQHQLGANIVPVFFNQFPAGTSLKVLRHIADLPLNRFGRYDYGILNMEKYGTYLPPAYDISKIEVPVFIMSAVNDWCCTRKDARILYNKLSPKAKMYGIHEITLPNFNHIDFLFGKNAKSIVYDNLVQLLNKIS